MKSELCYIALLKIYDFDGPARLSVWPKNTHRWGKNHCTAGLQFNRTIFEQIIRIATFM